MIATYFKGNLTVGTREESHKKRKSKCILVILLNFRGSYDITPKRERQKIFVDRIGCHSIVTTYELWPIA